MVYKKQNIKKNTSLVSLLFASICLYLSLFLLSDSIDCLLHLYSYLPANIVFNLLCIWSVVFFFLLAVNHQTILFGVVMGNVILVRSNKHMGNKPFNNEIIFYWLTDDREITGVILYHTYIAGKVTMLCLFHEIYNILIFKQYNR